MKAQPNDQPQTRLQPILARPFKWIGQLFNGSQRRFRLSRPGSVLILCVALLVLLALIGTAMISTTSIDRYTAAEHTYNTQIDLLVEGVKQMAEGWISSDLYQSANSVVPQTLFRPADADTAASGTTNFDKYDYIDTVSNDVSNLPLQNEAWLSPRVPQLQTFGSPIGPTNQPIWTALTMPLCGQTVNNKTVYQYESPYKASSTTTTIDTIRIQGIPTSITTASGIVYPAIYINNGTFMAADTDGDGIADAMYFKLPIGQVGGVTYYAACRIIDNNSAVNANTAWCRDWDFTNANSGFNRASNQSAGTINYGFFRSNVGFMEMFPDYTNGISATVAATSNQMNTGSQSINAYRFNGLDAAADYSPKVYYWDPVSKTVQSRSDFQYLTQGDGLEFGLASRLENPGINFFTPDGAGTADFRAFSWADTAALASRFAILNPSASPGDLETDGTIGFMSRTPNAGSPTAISGTAYSASDSSDWFYQNFDYDSAFGTDGAPVAYKRMPMRPIVVTRNPVSNLAPVPIGPYDYNGDGVGSTTFSAQTAPGGNDPLIPPYLTTTWTPSPSQVASAPIGMSPYLLGTGNAAVSAKTNINTAPFEELWRAFWSVMCEPKQSGQIYRIGACPPNYSNSAIEDAMFRSPSRDPRPSGASNPPQVRPSPSNMMQIRSALAAVNAIGLRDGSDDVISREVPIYDMTAAAPALKYRVRVFSNERQPFITKIYYNGYSDKLASGDIPAGALVDSRLIAGNQNQNGYVAIELYNPYPTPMQLNRWAIGVINRQNNAISYSSISGGPAGLHITRLSPRSPAMPSTAAPEFFDEHYLNQIDRVTGVTNNGLAYPNVVIPAMGYAVLENYPPQSLIAKGVSPAQTDAQFRPPRIFVTDAQGSGNMANIAFVYVPNLTDVIQGVSGSPAGGELVLLRPHRADGTLTSCTLPNNTYLEQFSSTVPNLADFVPVDSFDFSGLAEVTPSDTALYPSWYYARPNDTTTNAWKFVYPGLYNVGDTTTPTGISPATPRQEGTTGPGTDFTFAQLSADTGPKVVLGIANGGTYTNPFPGIQLQNVDWGKNSTYNRWPTINMATSHIAPIGFPAYPNTSAYYPGPPTPPPFNYPFGGFARNGDIMMTPFIGAYQILPTNFVDAAYLDNTVAIGTAQTPNPNPFYEFTPITMDCSFADDCQRSGLATRSSLAVRNTGADTAGANDDADEQVGRFCPIQETSPAGVQDLTPAAQTPASQPYGTASAVHWKYHFATRLFDYLTAQGPSDDYLPMADPNNRDVTNPPAPISTVYPVGTVINPTQNSLNPSIAADHRILAQTGIENRLPVDGLININTAPWYVIAQLPLLPQSSAGAMKANGIPANIETLAKEIVTYRDSGHPFTTLFDLNAFFLSAFNTIPQSSVVSGGTDWDISPNGTQAANDFEQKYLLLTRISNLVTTRSDSYTVFIVVDGFRGAGTSDPELVVHRRAAMIVDRSEMTPEAGTSTDRINVATQ